MAIPEPEEIRAFGFSLDGQVLVAGILDQRGADASAVVSCTSYLADLGDVARAAAAPGRSAAFRS